MKNIKNTLSVLVFTLVFGSLSAQQLQSIPRTSQRAEFSQTFGITKVTINYGAPRVNSGNNDRTGKIWGDLIPFGLTKINFASEGEIPWRAGADENTTITFSTDVKVEGKELVAGTYGLHIIIHDIDNATVIFSNNNSSWGSFWYDETEDALRVDVKIRDNTFQNVLNYSFTSADNDSAEISLSWEEKQIPLNVSADTKSIVAAGIKDELRGVAGFGAPAKLEAAQYFANNGIELNLAETLVDEHIASEGEGYTNTTVKANVYFQRDEMDKAANYLINVASKHCNFSQLDFLAYFIRKQGDNESALELFKINSRQNPDNPQAYYSLGVGYYTVGDKKNAIKMFNKSNNMNPSPQVKQGNDQFLEALKK